MKYPCGIIQDILPLYIDNACTRESREAVENHLPQCPGCRACYESMKTPEGVSDGIYRDAKDDAMETGLKKIKKRINKRLLLGITAAVVVSMTAFHLLFNAPLKEVSAEDLAVSVEVYAIDQLPAELNKDDNAVHIFAEPGDDSPAYSISIPAMPYAQVTLSENLMEKYDSISVVSYTCAYNIRKMGMEAPLTMEGEPDTVYIRAPRTTLLNNKSHAGMQRTQSLQFGEIDRVVFLEDDGTETILWEQDGE